MFYCAPADNEALHRAQIIVANKLNSPSASKTVVKPSRLFLIPRNIPPFIPAHDIVRGILHAGQAALGFAFMLVVMYISFPCSTIVTIADQDNRTFQVSFIIAIVVGLGVGEMLFGRYISIASAH